MAGRDLIFTILGIDRASPVFDKVGRSVDRTGKKLDSFGKISSAALGGTAVAAVGAGVGIAAALGGAALAVGALGIVAVSSNQQVRDSYTDLWANIKAGTKSAAEPLAPVLLGISDQMGDTFDEIQPRLRGLFTGSIPAMEHLTDGLTGMIRETMPGLERAVAASGPPMEAVRDVMIDTGKGATDFFTGLSTGSESSARILRVFGGIVRDSLGFTGQLLARLSNEGAPAVERLGQVFTQLLGVVTQLSTGALPVMFTAVGAGLNVFSGLLHIVGGSSAQLGPLIGLVISAATAFKLMDMVTFGGLSGQFSKVKTEITAAHTAGGKMRAGLTGLLTGFGPVGLAAGGLGVMLGVLGKRQQEAAQKAAEHRQRVESLTDALVASGGAITANIEQQQIKAGQDASLYELAGRIGISQRTMTQALLGSKDAIGQVNRAWDENTKRADGSTKAWDDVSRVFHGFKGETGIGGVHKALGETREKFGALTGGMIDAQGAAAGIAEKQRDAASATDSHSAALSRLQEQLLGFVNKDLAYRMALDAEREAQERTVETAGKLAEAQKKADETVRKHGEGSKAAKDALVELDAATEAATAANFGWEQSIVSGVAAAGALAESQYRGSDAAELARLKTDAQNREIVRLAELAGNSAPPALRQMIGSMDRASLAALGVTTTVNSAGQAVYRLPNGKEIVLTAQDRATPVVQGIADITARLRDKTITITYLERRKLIHEERALGKAVGGPIQAGRPYVVGEQGPELIFPALDGFVANAAQTRRIMAGVRAESVHRVGGVATQQSAGRATHLHINFSGPIGSQRELENWLTGALDNLRRKGRA